MYRGGGTFDDLGSRNKMGNLIMSKVTHHHVHISILPKGPGYPHPWPSTYGKHTGVATAPMMVVSASMVFACFHKCTVTCIETDLITNLKFSW